MKKIILSAAMMAISALSFAQADALDQFFQKYEGKPGFTSVNVSEKLFALVASAAPSDDPELKQLVEGIRGVQVLAFENEEGNAKSKEYYKEAQAVLPTNGFEELMTVQSEDEKVLLLGKVSSESVIDEMILICDDNSEFVLVRIEGKIDMKNISRLSEMGIDKLDELEKIEDK